MHPWLGRNSMFPAHKFTPLPRQHRDRVFGVVGHTWTTSGFKANFQGTIKTPCQKRPKHHRAYFSPLVLNVPTCLELQSVAIHPYQRPKKKNPSLRLLSIHSLPKKKLYRKLTIDLNGRKLKLSLTCRFQSGQYYPSVLCPLNPARSPRIADWSTRASLPLRLPRHPHQSRPC